MSRRLVRRRLAAVAVGLLAGLAPPAHAAGPLEQMLARVSTSPAHPVSIAGSERGAVEALPWLGEGIVAGWVDTYSGNLAGQWLVLRCPAAPEPWRLGLYYNSQRSAVSGVLGPGWRFSYDIVFEPGVPTPPQATVTWGDGREDVFEPDGPGWRSAPDLQGTRVDPVAGGYELSTRHGRRYRFDAGGLLAWIADRHDRRLTLARDGLGRIASLTDADGRVVTLGYDGSGRLAQLAGPLLAAPAVLVYDGLGRLAGADGPAVRRARFEYDAQDRLVRTWDARDIPVTFGYVDPMPGAPPVVEWVRDPLRSRFFTWNQDSLVTAVYDSLAPGVYQEVRYRFDTQGRIVGVNDAARGTYACAYDPTGLVGYTDADGHTWSWTRDGLGNATGATDPTGAVWQATFDPVFSLPLTVQDPHANVWTATYDAFGDLRSAGDPLGNTHEYDYDALGRLVRQRDPLLHETRFAWDPLSGRLESARDPLGFTVSYARNIRGAVTSVTDQEGEVWSFARDDLDRLKVFTPPAPAGPWTYDWTPSGRLERTTDPLGHLNRYSYDAADRLVRNEDEVGAAWTWAWDGGRGLLQVTDPLGRQELRTADLAGRPLSRVGPDGDTWLCSWLDDEPSSVTGPDGVVTLVQFTPRHQLSRLETAGAINTYSYDGAGRLLGAKRDYPAEPTVAYLFSRDPAGRLTSERQAHLGRRTTYTLDAAGRVVQVRDDLGGVPVPITYDDRDQPVTMVLPGHPDPVTTLYTPRGRLRQVDYGAGMGSLYTYDAAGRMIGLLNATPLWSASYSLTRDSRGDVTELDTSTPGTGPLQLDMSFDPARRLVSETWSDGTPARAYSYDAVGNRTVVSDPAVTPYSYTLGHRLLSAGTLTQSWNASSRAQDWQAPPDAPYAYSYTPDRFLARVDRPPLQWRFLYGPFGELVRQDEPTAGTHWYWYDGQDRLIRRVDLPAPSSPPRVEQYYAPGPRLNVEVRPVADHWNSYLQNFMPLFTDAVGSVAQYAESTAVLVSERWHEPFGELHFSLGSTVEPDRGYQGVPPISLRSAYLITSYGLSSNTSLRQQGILGEVLRVFQTFPPTRPLPTFNHLPSLGSAPVAGNSAYLPSTGSTQADDGFGPEFIMPPWTGPDIILPGPVLGGGAKSWPPRDSGPEGSICRLEPIRCVTAPCPPVASCGPLEALDPCEPPFVWGPFCTEAFDDASNPCVGVAAGPVPWCGPFSGPRWGVGPPLPGVPR